MLASQCHLFTRFFTYVRNLLENRGDGPSPLARAVSVGPQRELAILHTLSAFGITSRFAVADRIRLGLYMVPSSRPRLADFPGR